VRTALPVLTVVDDFSRECVGQLVDCSISGQRLARFLDQLAEQFQLPDQHWFRDLFEARRMIQEWRAHDNHVRPHSSLGYIPPAVFAEHAA